MDRRLALTIAILGAMLVHGSTSEIHMMAQASPLNVEACCGLTPTFIATLYDLTPGFTGAGIHVIVLSPFAVDPRDIEAFSRDWGLPPPLVELRCASVATSPGCQHDARSIESTLNVEWIHAIAPNARIEQLMPASANVLDMVAAYRIASESDAQIVLTTWGACEQSPPGLLLSGGDQFIGNGAARGQLWITASGDKGSRDCNGEPSVNFPASSPHVLTVGGTSLACDARDCNEVGWAGSGGGRSILFPRPPSQLTGPSLARELPDVAAVAHPGLTIVFQSRAIAVAGTSAAAPIWAGFAATYLEAQPCTIPADLRERVPLDGLAQDVRQGSNGDFHATEGYDLVTGWGTPRGAGLAPYAC